MTELLESPPVAQSAVWIVDSLRECADEDARDHLGSTQYMEWRAERLRIDPSKKLPHLQTIRNHFGDFATALAAAGLRTVGEVRGAGALDYISEPTGLDEDEERVVAYALSALVGERFRGKRTYAYH